MKKSTIYYSTGTLVLAVAGFLVTKANKKFTQHDKAHVHGLSGVTVSCTGHFTDVHSLNSYPCFLATKQGSTVSLYTLVTVVLDSHQMYFK